MSKFELLDRGARETILLIPGWATDHRIFGSLDLPFNYLLPVEYSPFNFAGDLLSAMKKNGLKKISALGWSMGAFVICECLKQCVGAVDGVALVSARRAYERPDNENIKLLLMKNRKGFLRKFYSDCFPAAARDAYNRMKEGLLKDYCEGMELGRLVEGLDYLSSRRIDPRSLEGVPVKFIHGREDRIAPMEEAEAIKDELPQADFIVLDGEGHMPFLAKDFKRIFDEQGRP
ncbi:MAG: alpha/beta hydrolase [Candidatus Omnitrophica bacterium]|nr:alpha/beta hydrolase [Candidatus Omnitrophota bacterium]